MLFLATNAEIIIILLFTLNFGKTSQNFATNNKSNNNIYNKLYLHGI